MNVSTDVAKRSTEENTPNEPINVKSDVESTQPNPDVIPQISPQDRFSINGRDYIKSSVLGGTKRGKTTSWIWDHGIEIMDIKNEKRLWKCTICKKPVIYNPSSTDHPMNHLARTHRLNKDGPIISKGQIEVALQKPSTVSTLILKTDQQAFQKVLLEWIVDMHIPFSVVENAKFQAWMRTTTPAISILLPKDGDTIRNWILKEFKVRQIELIEALKFSKSLVHFSCDLWTSPHYRSILGIVGTIQIVKAKTSLCC